MKKELTQTEVLEWINSNGGVVNYLTKVRPTYLTFLNRCEIHVKKKTKKRVEVHYQGGSFLGLMVGAVIEVIETY